MDPQMKSLPSLLCAASLLAVSCASINNPYEKTTYSYGSPEDSLALKSDLVIEGCKITFRGKPIPLGGTSEDYLATFGKPTDTVDVKNGEHCLYWGDIGFRACSAYNFWGSQSGWSIASISYHYGLKTSYHPKIRATSTFGIRPYGRFTTDESHNREIISNAFHYTSDYIPGGENETWMKFTPVPNLFVKLTVESWGEYIDIKHSYGYQTLSYPEVFKDIPSSCKAE